MQKKKQSLLSDFLRELFITGIDGVTILFFITSGLISAGLSNKNIGIIGIVAGILISLTISISAYISRKAEKKHFLSLDSQEILAAEDLKEKRLLENLGIGKHIQSMAQEEIEKDRKHWQNLMMKLDEEYDTIGNANAIRNAVITGAAYLSGCLIPLIPYLFGSDRKTGFQYSIILTLCTLFILGYYKSISLKTPLIGGAIASVLTGILTGIGGYLIARLFVQII